MQIITQTHLFFNLFLPRSSNGSPPADSTACGPPSRTPQAHDPDRYYIHSLEASWFRSVSLPPPPVWSFFGLKLVETGLYPYASYTITITIDSSLRCTLGTFSAFKHMFSSTPVFVLKQRPIDDALRLLQRGGGAAVKRPQRGKGLRLLKQVLALWIRCVTSLLKHIQLLNRCKVF